MSWPGELSRRVQMLLHRRQFQTDLDEEMRLHLELRQEQQMESEWLKARRARLRGGVLAIKPYSRRRAT